MTNEAVKTTPQTSAERVCKTCNKSKNEEADFRVARRTGKKTYYRGECKQCEAEGKGKSLPKPTPPPSRLPDLHTGQTSYPFILEELEHLIRNEIVKLSPKSALRYFAGKNHKDLRKMNPVIVEHVLKAYDELRRTKFPYIKIIHPLTRAVETVNGTCDITAKSVRNKINVINVNVLTEYDEVAEMRKELDLPLTEVEKAIEDIEAKKAEMSETGDTTPKDTDEIITPAKPIDPVIDTPVVVPPDEMPPVQVDYESGA